MDWTKAKTILIVALILTNLVLVIAVISNKSKVDQTLQVTVETMDRLQQKNIKLKAELDLKRVKMPVLFVEYGSYDKSEISEAIAQQKSNENFADNEESARKISDAFIKDCGFMTKEVNFSNVTKEGGVYTVTYNSKIKGREVVRSEMLCQVKNGVVINFHRDWLNPIDFGRTKKSTVSITTALMKFMSEKTGDEEIIIEQLDLVYWLDASYVNPEKTESDTAFPAWRIRYNGGKEKFILAYDTK